MARIRTIKPEFFDDEDIARLSFPARLAFAGLWTQADREGRLADRPARLKARLFPYDDVDIDALLGELVDLKFIERYEVDGARFIQVRTFGKHQHVHIKEPASTIPAPCENGASTGRAPVEPVGLLTLDSGLLEGKGKDSSGDEDADFDLFWEAYPRKDAKVDARKAWKTLKPSDAMVTHIVKAVEKQARSPGWRDRNYIPLPASWLRGKRWEDEGAQPRAGPSGVASWRERCRELGHDPACQTVERCKLVQDKAARLSA